MSNAPLEDRPPSGRVVAEVDAKAIIRALAQSGLLDGLVRRLDGSFSTLATAAVEDCVADAVGQVYDALVAGRRVSNPEGYVYKVAKNLAIKENDRLMSLARPNEFPEVSGVSGGEEPSRDILRSEALRVARQLLPRLGQENVIKVMGLILDAIESDIADLPNGEIADTLDLSPAVVRQSKSRGLSRLARLAEEEGLTLTLADVAEDNDDEEEEDEADDDE